jgi:N6-L-threonylcarbamoyladenine synthase
MLILGIETSCDETAVSLIRAEGSLQAPKFESVSSAINSQIAIHQEYGGVFPKLAKREHIKNLPIVLNQALQEAGLDGKIANLDREVWQKNNPNQNFPIDLITVTVGPGLEPALWVGIKFAEELGQKWQIPVVGTNHMEGHIVSVLLNKENSSPQEIQFPALALLVSGGHTELVFLNDWQTKQKIGETKDDAVGEAFDKVARMLGLPYPGGPQISRLANEAREQNSNLETKFPRPMLHSKDFNFSFSGLKTAVLYYLRDNPSASKILIAREFEDAVIETLLTKTKLAIEKFNPKTLVIGGGVIANTTLRANFLNLKNDYSELEILIPEKSLTTDNATMIAIAGYLEYLRGNHNQLKAQGNLDIK